MIRVNRDITIDDPEIVFKFIRSSGPGGQNVNKVATAVRLRFDAARSPSLPDDVRGRLMRIAGGKLGADGVLTILARRHRTQEANRRDAVERLAALVRRAAVAPKPRRRTKPTAGSRMRRLEGKRLAGRKKAARRAVDRGDE
jgi:ribosome-associated protein